MCIKRNQVSLSLLPMAQGLIRLRATMLQCRSRQNQPICRRPISLQCRRLPTRTWHTTPIPALRHQCSLPRVHQPLDLYQMPRHHHTPTFSMYNIIGDQYHPKRKARLCPRNRNRRNLLPRHNSLPRRLCLEPINSRIGSRPRRPRPRNKHLKAGDIQDSFPLSHSMSL